MDILGSIWINIMENDDGNINGISLDTSRQAKHDSMETLWMMET